MPFKDNVVWITGASSGIGEALAYELSRRGAKLVLSSRRREALEQVKQNCSGNPNYIFILPLDLSEFGQLPQKTYEVLSEFGRIDYLFNNGGISQRSYAVDTDFEVLRKVMDINFLGTARLTQAVLPAMLDQQSGHIVVTSSVMGKFGTRLRSSYAASKHALHGYFDSLRQEVHDHNVNVTLVCPGYIKTNVTLNALKGDGSQLGEMGHGQEEGMEPEAFVKKLLPAVEKGKQEVYIGGTEVMGIYLKRFVPRLFHWILRQVDVT